MRNVNGRVVPNDPDTGRLVGGNRLKDMCALVADNVVDICIGVEAHMDENGAQSVRKYVHKEWEDLKAECAPNTEIINRLTEDCGWGEEESETEDTHTDPRTKRKAGRNPKHFRPRRANVGPAGIVVVMTKDMANRQAGQPRVAAGGRFMHLTFSGVRGEKGRDERVHLVVLYGVSGGAKKGSDRERLANALQMELKKTLLKHLGEKMVVCGDVNSVADPGDRQSWKLLSYDKAEYALTTTLNESDYDLVDVMRVVCGDAPPKTLCKAGIPISRIDVVFMSQNLMGGAKAATVLEADPDAHRMFLFWVYSIEWTDEKHNTNDFSEVMVLKTGVRPQRWRMSKQDQGRYLKKLESDEDIEARRKGMWDEYLAKRSAAEFKSQNLQISEGGIKPAEAQHIEEQLVEADEWLFEQSSDLLRAVAITVRKDRRSRTQQVEESRAKLVEPLMKLAEMAQHFLTERQKIDEESKEAQKQTRIKGIVGCYTEINSQRISLQREGFFNEAEAPRYTGQRRFERS